MCFVACNLGIECFMCGDILELSFGIRLGLANLGIDSTDRVLVGETPAIVKDGDLLASPSFNNLLRFIDFFDGEILLIGLLWGDSLIGELFCGTVYFTGDSFKVCSIPVKVLLFLFMISILAKFLLPTSFRLILESASLFLTE